jgi:hypothetical protein
MNKSGAAKKKYPNIMIANSVTTGTRVRRAILRAYAKAYMKENPQGSATVTAFTSRPHFGFRAGKTLRQTSFNFDQTVMVDDLPYPVKEDLESAYRIASAKQFRGRLRDVFMVLSDDHSKKPTGDAVPSLSEPFVIPASTKEQSKAQLQEKSKEPSQEQSMDHSGHQAKKPPAKGNKRKGSSGYMTVEFKLSRSDKRSELVTVK